MNEFDQLCDNMVKTLRNVKPFDGKTLMDFSAAITEMIEDGNDNSDNYSEEFRELQYGLQNYYMYKANEDNNRERAFSYVIANQAANMLQINHFRKLQERKIAENMSFMVENLDIFREIHCSSIISDEELKQNHPAEPSRTENIIKAALDKGIVTVMDNVVPGKNCFLLTSFGLVLYKKAVEQHYFPEKSTVICAAESEERDAM
ncbi:MAG: hypothetical protein IJI14_05040 [Anaerolineaceae bacterium]|nr:hypothetical protein [Anaerolineaceae bacterium]